MATILVADDDAYIRELICLFLSNEGFRTIQADNGAEALTVMETSQIDLVVLDIMMPIMDGFQLCSELRPAYPDIPMLMVTAKGETSHKVKGFQLGTDDYLVKPFEPVELVMRVKALLKRYRIASSHMIQLGDVTLNRETYKVTQGMETSALPLKEFELLFTLASYPGQIFTREQLIQNIWGIDYEGDERTVDVHIKRLRERFAGESAAFRIDTVRGLGYRLEARE
jgi:DNA-binding response OmpR family regulator